MLTNTGFANGDALGHVHLQTLLSRTQSSQTLLFTNTGLATPCHALGTPKRSSHAHRTRTGSCQPHRTGERCGHKKGTHRGITVVDGTAPGFTDAAVTNEGFARVRSYTQLANASVTHTGLANARSLHRQTRLCV